MSKYTSGKTTQKRDKCIQRKSSEISALKAEIDALKAQRDALLAAQQWRDIESAPRDQTMQKTTLEMLALARITRNAHGYDFLSIPRRNAETREIYNACGSIRVATRDTEVGTINSDEWIVEQLNSVKVGEFVIHRVKDFRGARETKWTKIESDCWGAP